jgi:hypothetical protein
MPGDQLFCFEDRMIEQMKNTKFTNGSDVYYSVQKFLNIQNCPINYIDTITSQIAKIRITFFPSRFNGQLQTI